MAVTLPDDPKARLFQLEERFQECLIQDPELFARMPERFVLVVWPLDDPEALAEALADLRRLRAWEGEEGPLVYALFREGELLGVVLPGEVVPARAA